jgi:RHS repeat-associated protein
MLSTYYVYDIYGNLTFMLPPELNPDRDGTTAPTTTELNNFATQYIYDEYNRMVLRRLPGKGWENTIYNPMDWVIFHQDARQETETIPGFTPGQYHTFHKYDSQGRLVIKGIERNRVWDRISIQNAIKTQTHQWEKRDLGVGNLHGYTNLAIPTNAVDMEVQEVYYYDSYADIPDLPENLSSTHSKLVHGKLVASKVRVLGTASFLWTVYYYNDKGELVNKYEQHYQAAKANKYNYDRYQQTYYFNGLPNATTRDHFISNSGNSEEIFQVKVQNTFTFDHRNRELLNYNSINSASPTFISGKSYNEIGQLISLNLHSTTSTTWGQQIGYQYNARGWLTSITSPLFTQQLKYNDGATPQYNGNVADQVFTRKNTVSTPVNVTDTYTYDHLSRMLQGQMAGGKGRETLVYDKGGNITSLTRTNAAAAVVDQLTYTYAGGRLSTVVDANASTDTYFQTPGTTTYTYDINGNMKSRINTASTANNLTSIVYNQLNLPQTVTTVSATVNYVYDAYGRKLRSVGAVGGSGVTREYINGIEYIGGALSTIDHAQGRIVKTGTVYSYDYTIRDHLGNNRSGFAQGISVTVPNFTADYYPFGLRYLQYERPGTPTNHYLYNSNEWQGAIKQYDFNARFYDPVIARFAQVDPLADMFGQQTVSSYSAFWNSPVNFQDKWGLCPECDAFENPQKGDSVTSSGITYVFDGKRWYSEEEDQYWGEELEEVNVTPKPKKKNVSPLWGPRPFDYVEYRNKINNARDPFLDLVEFASWFVPGEAVFAKGASYLAKLAKGLKGVNSATKGAPKYLYHYTSKEAAQSISQQGLKVGKDGFSYLTNKGNLSSLQAQIELALPANRALPNSILRIDASGLNPALIRRVSGNLPGYGAGGGTEFLFNQHIPANLIKVIK